MQRRRLYKQKLTKNTTFNNFMLETLSPWVLSQHKKMTNYVAVEAVKNRYLEDLTTCNTCNITASLHNCQLVAQGCYPTTSCNTNSYCLVLACVVYHFFLIVQYKFW